MQLKNGFTLIEILVGIGLMALMTTLGFFQMRNYEYTCMRQQIALFALSWYELQQRAMAQNKQEDMLLDQAGHRYYAKGQWQELPAGIQFGFLPNTKGPPAFPTTLLTSAITFPGEKVSCFPDGTIQAGTVYLINDKKSCMYALTSGVAAVSFLRKYRYDGTWRGY